MIAIASANFAIGGRATACERMKSGKSIFVALTMLRLSQGYSAGLNLDFGERTILERKVHERHKYTFVSDRVKLRSRVHEVGA
jgi:recombinational DNA repair protein RecR